MLVLVVHHIVSDAWALQLLSSDLNAALEAALENDSGSINGISASGAVVQKLDKSVGKVPLQQMDYSAWLCNQLVSPIWKTCSDMQVMRLEHVLLSFLQIKAMNRSEFSGYAAESLGCLRQ